MNTINPKREILLARAILEYDGFSPQQAKKVVGIIRQLLQVAPSITDTQKLGLVTAISVLRESMPQAENRPN